MMLIGHPLLPVFQGQKSAKSQRSEGAAKLLEIQLQFQTI
jgi:hypothetical protein